MIIKVGTSNNDSLIGTAGRDLLYGLAGNDNLFGNSGNDTLAGGDGNDTLDGGTGADKLNGGTGNDVFKYSHFNDLIGDTIIDFSAGDSIDFSSITGAKFIGNAQFNGVAGEIRYYDSSASINVNMVYKSTVSIDIDGDAQEDIALTISNFTGSFNETALNSLLLNIATNQTLTGTDSVETLTGGTGNDTLAALGGNDVLLGGEGNDSLDGGGANDTLDGGLGNDVLTGGAGNDVFRFNNPDDFINSDSITDLTLGDQIVLGFDGITFISVNGFSRTAGEYRYTGSRLEFDFDGNGYADQIIRISGTTSLDSLTESGSGSNRVISFLLPVNGSAGNDTITGGNGHDTINGLAGNDSISGGEGNNSLSGGDGNDKLSSASGNDTLDGGAGNDTLDGGLGNDNLTGGDGKDVFKFNSVSEFNNTAYNKGTIINDLSVGDTIDLSAIKGLSFAGVDNYFTGVANQLVQDYGSLELDTNGDKYSDGGYIAIPENIVIRETSSGSSIFEVVANKNLSGTFAKNILKGDDGYDTLDGGAGNDSLLGFKSSDQLNGGDGNDVLIGGAGWDFLTGGAGNDTFKFQSLDDLKSNNRYSFYEGDVIEDFTTGDKIDLKGIDANTNQLGDQGFTFIGNNSFSGASGELIYRSYGNNFIQGDINGDATADFTIYLGNIAPVAKDFLL